MRPQQAAKELFTPAEKARLLALCDAVPADAGDDHPAVVNLLAYWETVDPGWPVVVSAHQNRTAQGWEWWLPWGPAPAVTSIRRYAVEGLYEHEREAWTRQTWRGGPLDHHRR